MKLNLSKLVLALTSAAAITLSGCGGGGAAKPTAGEHLKATASPAPRLGLPLVGTVTVKDVNGDTRTVTIDENDNGLYTVDVTGMTAPPLCCARRGRLAAPPTSCTQPPPRPM